MDLVDSNKCERRQELVCAYRNALYDGDLIGRHEVLALAEQNPKLSAQLESIEQEVIAKMPNLKLDWDRITGNIERGETIQRILDSIVTSLQRYELTIRAVFNIWPVGASIVFGLACFILAHTESSAEIRHWLFIAAVSLGSLLIVCTTSLWRLRKKM